MTTDTNASDLTYDQYIDQLWDEQQNFEHTNWFNIK
jgi:hypothetical protein